MEGETGAAGPGASQGWGRLPSYVCRRRHRSWLDVAGTAEQTTGRISHRQLRFQSEFRLQLGTGPL